MTTSGNGAGHRTSGNAGGLDTKSNDAKSNAGQVLDTGRTPTAKSIANARPETGDDWLERGTQRTLLVGYAMIALLIGGVAAWASSTPWAGAVLANGTVVVENDVKKVQHPTGGVIGQLYVQEGERVAAGQLLVRLDDTVTRANLQVIIKQLDEMAIRMGRLRAERDNLDILEVPASLGERRNEPDVAAMIEGERTLLEFRRVARESQRAQLRERIAQLRQEIIGSEAHIEAKAREIALQTSEVDKLEVLWAKQLVSLGRYTAAQREAVRLEDERSQLVSSIAQSKGRIDEIEVEILQIDRELNSEVVRELRDLEAKTAELIERRTAAEDVLMRVDITAPVAGTVHSMNVHTVGGVVSPSEPVMLIIPQEAKRVLDVRLALHESAQVVAGQPAFVRFTAFNQRTTPEIEGSVQRVAADVTREPNTGATYYLARIAIPDDQLRRLGDVELIAGMPAAVSIRTSDRSPLSYVSKPLSDYVARMFRER